MGVFITKRYYSRTRRGEEPIRFRAERRNSNVHATIRMDPILKKHPDLRKALVRHETTEIKQFARGKKAEHTTAKRRESKLIRDIGGVSGFWREIKRREKGRKKGRR